MKKQEIAVLRQPQEIKEKDEESLPFHGNILLALAPNTAFAHCERWKVLWLKMPRKHIQENIVNSY
jgi:hypothetical protein